MLISAKMDVSIDVYTSHYEYLKMDDNKGVKQKTMNTKINVIIDSWKALQRNDLRSSEAASPK